MSTFTKTPTGYGYTCDTCGLDVGSHWRNKIAHTAGHERAEQLAARQARIDAQHACGVTGLDCGSGVGQGRLMGTNEPASAQTLTGSGTSIRSSGKDA